MTRVFIYLLSICLCMTQAIGLLHGVAHNRLMHGAVTHGAFTNSHTGHEIVREKPSLASASPSTLAEHDKQTCLLIDALATAAGLLNADFSIHTANLAVANVATLQALSLQSRRIDYWPTGPPTI